MIVSYNDLYKPPLFFGMGSDQYWSAGVNMQAKITDPQNMIKAIRMRFGQLLKFVEKVGISLSDPSGNELHMNEATKSTTLTVPETLTLNCKNLIINASQSITTTAGMNITETATLNKTLNVGGILDTSVGLDKILHVAGDNHINIDGNSNSEVKKDRNIASENRIVTHSEIGHEFHSDKDIKNNSSEQTRQN